MEILISIITLGSLGVIFGVGLAIASKRLAVTVDPRLEKIHGLLPGSNCGACGGAGCFGFAENLLSGKANINACRVSNDKSKEQIAGVLGQKLEKNMRQVAVLHCNGGSKVKNRFIYDGLKDCIAANLVLKGEKDCIWGCLGFGTCVKACPFDALTMKDSLPTVDPSKCKACNKCVQVCPKKLFTLIPAIQTVAVSCRSLERGSDVRVICPVGCIACKLCEKACKFDAIRVSSDNLAYIDYKKCTSCGECVKVCPTKTINFLKK